MVKKELVKVSEEYYIDVSRIHLINYDHPDYYIHFNNENDYIKLKKLEFKRLEKFLKIIDPTKKDFLTEEDIAI